MRMNKNANVIVGLNGSGKSAILTALAIGLGARANTTSRSTNLKELVKRGESSATIEIALSNDGVDAFERMFIIFQFFFPNFNLNYFFSILATIYGKEITVIRTINGNSGVSIYKLRGENGKIISTGRQELAKLTLCLNIQVENPVLILNQDAARSFLKECDPKKLYQFFLKATQIESITEKLSSCFKISTTTRSQLEHLQRSIKQYESEVQMMKGKHEILLSLTRLRNEIDTYKIEIEWLRVTQTEKELEEAQKQLQKHVADVNKILHFIKSKASFDTALKDKIRDLGTEFQKLAAFVTEKSQACDGHRVEFEKDKDALSKLENHFQILDNKTKQLKINIQQLETDLAERESNPTNVENMRKENEAKILKLEKKIGDLKLIIENAKRDYRMFSDTLVDLQDKIQSAKNISQQESLRLTQCTNQVTQLQGSSKEDSLSVYGRSMSNLISTIETYYQQRKFSEMPRGPLGRYIKVTDKKYRSAVENILESTLRAFYVSCDKDRVTLYRLLKDFPEFQNTQVIMGKFIKQQYDVRNGIVHLNRSDNGRILMDLIKVSDPVVMNCLIDQRSIENIVLVPDTATAIQFTQETENVPQNLRRVVCLKPFSEFFPAPNYRTYTMQEKPPRFIQSNVTEIIAGLEEQQQKHKQRLQEIKNDIEQLNQHIRDQQKLVGEKRKLINELQSKEQTCMREIADLKSVEYPEENDSDYLRTELETLQKKLKYANKKLSEIQNEVETAKEVVREKEGILRQQKDDVRRAQEQMTESQHKIDHCQQQLNEMKNDIKSKKSQLTGMQIEQEQCEQIVEGLKEKIKNMFDNINGERIPCQRTEEKIQQLIRSTEKQIMRIEKHKENIEDVELLLNNKIQQVTKMTNVRDGLEGVLSKLEELRTSRFYYMKKLRQHMTLLVKYKFCQLMSIRHYKSEVNFDHKNGTLELKVIPRDAEIEDAVSNTKSLSGGERSYSTVAFLIALWSCVDHPFYFLDEYDVFSDEHNRFMMTKLLLHEADTKPNKQYGFLTPQEFTDIPLKKEITIHKLQDPDRMN